MNAAQLLTHFDRISEAPDAIPRLRRFILDLAVRGKLVEQDPNDEPASKLLARIQTARAQLVAQGIIARRSEPTAAVEERPPLAAPRGWAFTTLGQVALKITDGTHKTPTYVDEGVPFISVKDFSGGALDFSSTRFISPAEHAVLHWRCDPRRGDILIGRIGTLGKAVLVDTDREFSLFVSVGLIRFSHDLIAPAFLRLLLNSPHVEAEFDRIKIGGGTHTNKLNLGDLHTVALPLPPLAEQHRIVTKVNELMALCDRLEAAQAERESRRGRLAAASLNRLNQPAAAAGAPAFRDRARFHLIHLPRLTTRPEHIQQLRQTILNLAVRGQLVPQDPNDEPLPAFETRPPEGDLLPFQVPRTWSWSRLRSLGQLKGGGTPSKSRTDFWGGSVPWVSPKDMKQDYIEKAQLGITEEALAASPVTVIEPGGVLFVVRGMILAHSFPVAIARVPLTINQDMKAVILDEPRMAEFLLRALKGLKPQILSRVQRSSHGTCRLEGRDYSDLPVPLPPVAEQHRIVAKVDELMALCDQLEAQLTTAQAESRRLLEAVLHQALEPAA